MFNGSSFLKIADQSFVDITQRLARLKMTSQTSAKLDSDLEKVLLMSISGDYSVLLLLRAEEQLLRVIAENMKRSAISDPSDISVYVMEYFNIFCGHAVSRYNILTRSSARFELPKILNSDSLNRACSECRTLHELCYTCNDGPAKIQILYNLASQSMKEWN